MPYTRKNRSLQIDPISVLNHTHVKIIQFVELQKKSASYPMNQKKKALRKGQNFFPAALKFYIAVTGHRKPQNACSPNDSDLLHINSIYVWSCESVQDCRCVCEQQYAHTLPCSTSNKITNYVFKAVYKISDISASVQLQSATFSEHNILRVLEF